MVIPWVGFPLADLLKRVEPHGQRQVRRVRDAGATRRDAGPARPVPGAGLALCRGAAPGRGDAPADDPGGRPLRRDAAQPERRAAPAGGAVEVRLQEHQVDRAHQPGREASRRPPGTSRTPSEYGFYANVNPEVDHPRWSQATERRIGEGGLFAKRRADAAVQRLRRPGGRASTPAWTCESTTDMAARPTCRAARAALVSAAPARRASTSSA